MTDLRKAAAAAPCMSDEEVLLAKVGAVAFLQPSLVARYTRDLKRDVAQALDAARAKELAACIGAVRAAKRHGNTFPVSCCEQAKKDFVAALESRAHVPTKAKGQAMNDEQRKAVLTPWFAGGTRPARNGWYRAQDQSMRCNCCWFMAHWDGKEWHTASRKFSWALQWLPSVRRWRGIAGERSRAVHRTY